MLPRVEQNVTEWSRLRKAFECYHLEAEDGEMAAALQATLRRKGRQLEAIDALIAATAIRHHLVLLTSDKDFDAIPDLKRENWLALTTR